jgi:1-phosphofructokinase
MIITVTLNPALDKTVMVPSFSVGRLNRVASMRLDAGGKGINVSKVIQSLKGRSLAMGFLAGRTGESIKSTLDAEGIKNSFLFVDGETRTNLKIYDSETQATTEVNEPGPEISAKALDRFEALLKEKVRDGDVVVFSGSLPPKADAHLYQRLISLCRGLGARTILDADGEPLKQGAQAGPCLIKPNIHELEGLVGKKPGSIAEILHSTREIMAAHGIFQAVVSLGEKGALYCDDKQAFLARGLSVTVKSTVGAGDAMVAAMALSLERGCNWDTTIKLSMAAGAANAMTSGSQAASYESVMALMEKVHYTPL